MELARVKLGAEVKGDSGTCGRLSRVVVDPRTRTATHLVVRGEDGTERVLDARRVAEAHAEWLHAELSPTDFEALPHYEETDFSLPSAEWTPPQGWAHADILWPSDYARTLTHDLSPGPMEVEHVNVAPGSFDVAEGAAVHGTDRLCGHVSDVVFDPDTDRVEGFVVRRGFLFKRDVTVPMGWVERVGPDGVHLKMTARQVEELATDFPGEKKNP